VRLNPSLRLNALLGAGILMAAAVSLLLVAALGRVDQQSRGVLDESASRPQRADGES